MISLRRYCYFHFQIYAFYFSSCQLNPNKLVTFSEPQIGKNAFPLVSLISLPRTLLSVERELTREGPTACVLAGP